MIESIMIELLSKEPEVIDSQYETDVSLAFAVDEAYQSRQLYMQNLSCISVYTAELPDREVDDVYNRILDHERSIASNHRVEDYGDGSARYDDELVIVESDGPIVISADHATAPVRKLTGLRGNADHGTAGIALLMREEGQGSVVLPRGRQTGNVNITPEHPAKNAIKAQIDLGKQAFLSVHGMVPGRFEHQLDPKEVHAMIGLGLNPNEQSIEAAHELSRQMRQAYGLRAEVANWKSFYSNTPDSSRLKRRDDGSILKSTLAAFGEGTTTNYVRGLEQGDFLPAMQIELSRTLRLLPEGVDLVDPRRGIQEVKMGVYLGFLLNSEAGRILAEYGE